LFGITTGDLIVVKDSNGQFHQIDIYPVMKSKHIRARLSELSGAVAEAYFLVDEQSHDRVLGMLREIWPQLRVEHLPSIEAGSHGMPGKAIVSVTDHYMRAIAKIALHYYLCWNKRGLTGRETCFDDLRKFIRHGGDPGQFVQTPKPPKPGARQRNPPDRGIFHRIMVDEWNAHIDLRLRFFVGLNPIEHVVRLGERPFRILTLDAVRGHMWVYDSLSVMTSRYGGHIEPMRIETLPTSLWIPPSCLRPRRTARG
jgi:hypothetical protein